MYAFCYLGLLFDLFSILIVLNFMNMSKKKQEKK